MTEELEKQFRHELYELIGKYYPDQFINITSWFYEKDQIDKDYRTIALVMIRNVRDDDLV